MWEIEQAGCMLFMIICSAIDIKNRKLPLIILGAGGIGAVFFQLIERKDSYLFIGGIMIGLFFCGISKVTNEGLGYGDSLVIMILGMLLGMWKVIYLLSLSFFCSAVFAVIYLVCRPRNRRKAIPFIPFLTLGYIGVILL